MNKPTLLYPFLILSACVGYSSAASAALIEYAGANHVLGSDGVNRYISISMIFDDVFNQNPGTPPPLPGSNLTNSFGHFDIASYTVDVEGLGVFAGTNDRLNIWYNRTPASFTYYTEELEALEDHNLMRFYDGTGNPWDWSPWLDATPEYILAPELVIPRFNISPGYSYDLGNEIHLHPVPLPGTVSLFVIGLVGIAFYARRRFAGSSGDQLPLLRA